MFKRSPLKAPRLIKRKRKIFLLKIAGVILAAILIILGFSLLSKVKALAIQKIQVEGNSAIDTQDVEAIARKNLSGNYFLLLSKSNRLLFPKHQIEYQLATTFKRIETVE